MEVRRVNHVVLLVSDLERSASFYEQALGMYRTVAGDRLALHFGESALLLVRSTSTLTPHPEHLSVGGTSICFEVAEPIEDWHRALRSHGFEPTRGPVTRVGAEGAVRSVYLDDPDGNQIELASTDRRLR